MAEAAGRIFQPLLFNLRAKGVPVGLNEWLAFLDGLRKGLARDLDGVYRLARALLVHTEAHYDAFDLAFNASFAGVELHPELKAALDAWLNNPRIFDENREAGVHGFESLEALMEALRKTLDEQQSRHEGGNRWVGTGGTSPYGNSGRANQGVRVGGASSGGRAGIAMQDRAWANYRTDLTLDVRQMKVALRALRKLAREGTEVLDLDETISETARNGGEIDLVFDRERANRVRLVLMMDAGGSMAPHYKLVSQLFTAAQELKTFKTFEHYYFHNCVYNWLYTDYENFERQPTRDVLAQLTPQHRLIMVGDASMAPWELFSNYAGFGDNSPSGLDWLRRLSARCPSSVWLNPDPERYWNHPTVRAIGQLFPMHPLTVDGLRAAVKHLRRVR
ncbi:MAG: VWA domain-containing protein [Alphaproteobacteria bacterium]|nr:VWA domain-containing protein [Alphaproteobacteria bacterium]